MARFDVFPNPSGQGYLLDIQADLLSDLNTRIVVPVLPLDQAPTPAKRLNPVLQIDGTAYVMATQFMAAVPVLVLKNAVTNLSDTYEDVTNALDMVFFGF